MAARLGLSAWRVPGVRMLGDMVRGPQAVRVSTAESPCEQSSEPPASPVAVCRPALIEPVGLRRFSLPSAYISRVFSPLNLGRSTISSALSRAASTVAFTPRTSPSTVRELPTLSSHEEQLRLLDSDIQKEALQLAVVYGNVLGVHASNEGDTEAALVHFGDSARAGLPAALFNLGICHHQGKGVPVNLEKALRFYIEAGKRGHANACQNAASLLAQKGKGLAARSWLQRAIDLGNVEASVTMALYKLNGRPQLHIEQDTVAAIKLLKAAAAKGSANAHFYLGVCYDNGTGVQKNPDDARAAFKAAVSAGHARAAVRLSLLTAPLPAKAPPPPSPATPLTSPPPVEAVLDSGSASPEPIALVAAIKSK